MAKQPDRRPIPHYIAEAFTDDEIISSAKLILRERFKRGIEITNPTTSKDYVHLELAEHEQEVFACIFLDNRHRVILFEKLFFGTLADANVHPREVVKRTLELNAGAVILAHNHPSGIAEPSIADRSITKRLQNALELIDVRVLDHIVVGAEEVVSFAERGLL
ncbi:MAG: DNA repair protein RadC [Candidatus Thiodiazotropha sp. (ex Lucinoma borealis)]|nr:DNA repair protein RadC [Candidatus Thiodiazotropha sp. (ex Lucinoma borealis)]